MGKRLSHAPVFFVVAQVRHSPILKLDVLVPDLQDKFRKSGFPGYRALKRINFEVGVNEASPQETTFQRQEVISHIFSSRNGTDSFVSDKDSFAFQTVEYDTFETFSETFHRGISAMNEVFGPDSFSSVGLRFLDAIAPRENEIISKYIHKQFLGLQDTLDEEWQVDYTFNETTVVRKDQKLKTRVLTRDSQLMWPPDLAVTAPLLPERFASLVGLHALVDTDASFSVENGQVHEFDVSTVLARLKSLKSDISKAFAATVTPEALKVWE